MHILIERMYTIKVPVENGELLYLPLLTMTKPLEDFGKRGEENRPIRKLIPIGEPEKRYLMTFSEIQKNLSDFLRKLVKEDGVYYKDTYFPSWLYGLLGTFREPDEIKLFKRPEDIEEDIYKTTCKIIGRSFEYIESLEGWTRAGYPLYFKSVGGGSDLIKKRILATNDFEELKWLDKPGVENFFIFTNEKAYNLQLIDLFMYDFLRENRTAPSYYVIDITPDETQKEKKRYLASKKAFVKTAIGTRYPSEAMTFRDEEEALAVAFRHVGDMPFGGFEIIHVNEPIMLAERMQKGAYCTLWSYEKR